MSLLIIKNAHDIMLNRRLHVRQELVTCFLKTLFQICTVANCESADFRRNSSKRKLTGLPEVPTLIRRAQVDTDPAHGESLTSPFGPSATCRSPSAIHGYELADAPPTGVYISVYVREKRSWKGGC